MTTDIMRHAHHQMVVQRPFPSLSWDLTRPPSQSGPIDQLVAFQRLAARQDNSHTNRGSSGVAFWFMFPSQGILFIVVKSCWNHVVKNSTPCPVSDLPQWSPFEWSRTIQRRSTSKSARLHKTTKSLSPSSSHANHLNLRHIIIINYWWRLALINYYISLARTHFTFFHQLITNKYICIPSPRTRWHIVSSCFSSRAYYCQLLYYILMFSFYYIIIFCLDSLTHQPLVGRIMSAKRISPPVCLSSQACNNICPDPFRLVLLLSSVSPPLFSHRHLQHPPNNDYNNTSRYLPRWIETGLSIPQNSWLSDGQEREQ